jgi:hypothetical protein
MKQIIAWALEISKGYRSIKFRFATAVEAGAYLNETIDGLSVGIGGSATVKASGAYDLLSTTVYDGSFGAELARGMGMRIGRHANIDRVAPEDFTLLANECGLSKERLFAMARKLVEQVANRFDEAKQELAQATADDIGELASRIWTGIEARSRTLLR